MARRSRALLLLAAVALWYIERSRRKDPGCFLAGPAGGGGGPPGGVPGPGPGSASFRKLSEREALSESSDAPPLAAESSVPEEILAGISVAFSLLSKAIACSAIVGTGPLVGLWSCVALGLASLVGMRPGVVAGSAAVVVVPLGAFAATNGLALVPLVVLLAAAIEFLAGIVGFARTLDLVSKEVLAGFLNALGLALLVSQSAALSTPMGFSLAIICAALTQFLPSAPIPSSLVGLAVATAVGLAFNFDVPTLAMKAKDPTAFSGGLAALPPFQLPQMPSMDDVQLALPCAISIAFISLIETLLAARVVDDRKCEDLCTFFYDENGELVQGGDPEVPLQVDVPTSTVLSLAAGNAGSVLLGGFGGAGLVPQTVLNLNSGGRGRWSIGSYAVSMVAFALVLAPLVGQISVPALAGIMVQVSLDTIQFKPTLDAFKTAFEGKEEDANVRLGILVITAVLCYQVDFAVGICTGVALDKGAEALKLKKAAS